MNYKIQDIVTVSATELSLILSDSSGTDSKLHWCMVSGIKGYNYS